MKTVTGNLITMAKAGQFDVIIHGCNCQCVMGAGIAKQLRANWPAIYRADLTTKKGDKKKLGGFTYIKTKNLVIVNAYTQFSYGREKRHADYNAISTCFKSIKKRYHGLRIGYPLIGCGLAGGDWNIISQIIDKELAGEDHTLVKFK
jgi:O-acetyl-ADP-ribose deacetylase (regulator of RNase III)